MKTTDNLDFYRKACQKFKDSGYMDLKSPKLYSLLCEASRHSTIGIGGNAFRTYVAGVYKDGVYLYANNHRCGIAFVTDSSATLKPNCQDARAHGNPWPRPSVGELLPFSKAPVPICGRILAIAKNLGEHVVGCVLDGCEAAEKERAKRKAEAETKEKSIIDKWTGGQS